jgi:hypothetical protein
MTGPTLDSLLAADAKVAGQLPKPEPRYRKLLGISRSFEDLLDGTHVHTTDDPTDVLGAASETGRLLIQAEAGAGKTTLLHELFRAASESGTPSFLIDLRNVTPEFVSRWQALRGEDVRRLHLLLTELGTPPVSERRLREVARESTAMIMVDGLNEAAPSVSGSLPFALDDLASRNPWITVVVTDRLLRRQLPSGWALASIEQVSSPGLQEVGSSRNALFLSLTEGLPEEATAADLLLEHIASVGGLEGRQLLDLAEAAYQLYVDHRARLFPLSDLRNALHDRVVEELLRTHLVQTHNEDAYFRHHLFHDALAARALTTDSQHWNSDAFDALTFNASSFDSLGLGLELLDTPELAEKFLLDVYDWNFYASAYALARVDQQRKMAVPESTRLALLALLAERRWDPFVPTVQRVEDALRVFRDPQTDRYLQVESLEGLLLLVESDAEGVPHTSTWLRIFLNRLPPRDLIALLGDGPLNAWMAANVVRRHDLAHQDRAALEPLLKHPDKTTRWRAVHVLGAQRDRRALQLLFNALDVDAWSWVRYGAVRAILEIAAREADMRDEALEGIRERLNTIKRDSGVFKELQNCLLLRDPPADWIEAVEPIVEELWAAGQTVEDQDHWRRVGMRIVESSRRVQAPAA